MTFKQFLPFIIVSILALLGFILSIVALSSDSNKKKVNDLEDKVNDLEDKFDRIKNGDIKVGNSKKLGGKLHTEYAHAPRCEAVYKEGNDRPTVIARCKDTLKIWGFNPSNNLQENLGNCQYSYNNAKNGDNYDIPCPLESPYDSSVYTPMT